LSEKIRKSKEEVKIALVGKYTGLDDAYLSVIESLKIACFHHERKLKLIWINSEKLQEKDEKSWATLRDADGILVPGGFGTRGIEGKIGAARYARENKIPYLGLCLGMQIMTIEFARHVLKDPDLTSEEFDEEGRLATEKYVIHFLPNQSWQKEKGGTLRLGLYPCKITAGTKTREAYRTSDIEERHRHRYEVNNDFRHRLEERGWVGSGVYQKGNLVEIAEIKDHPFMVGSQFHPEFLSRPNKPHPLFFAFIGAAVKKTDR
ncbi:CTP synthase, partial [Candidatus Peregrinibacteria bacterium]|nr:CTP synthase [Candidatus Peregrinibacteria bacterium]